MQLHHDFFEVHGFLLEQLSQIVSGAVFLPVVPRGFQAWRQDTLSMCRAQRLRILKQAVSVLWLRFCKGYSRLQKSYCRALQDVGADTELEAQIDTQHDQFAVLREVKPRLDKRHRCHAHDAAPEVYGTCGGNLMPLRQHARLDEIDQLQLRPWFRMPLATAFFNSAQHG